ncbi:hypothetical protein ABT039_22670 [Streptomyces lasiicapitis]|uniref:hypothetical protein n=1 Tax=Streptomyces lasiicapitis TaxID=1923961 RepID=UPI00331B95A4
MSAATAPFYLARTTISEHPGIRGQRIAEHLQAHGYDAAAAHVRSEASARNSDLTATQTLEALLRKAEADTLAAL